MNLQPHVIVLHWIRAEFKKLASHPEYLQFALGGYCYNPSMSSIYGLKFIDRAIGWLHDNEKNFNYNLGYRLDTSKIPSVTVMFSGGTESKQVMGDYAGSFLEDVYPKKYCEFHAVTITEEGWLVVPNEYHVENLIWRGLVIQKSNVTPRVITGLMKQTDTSSVVIQADRPFVLEDGLSDWQVYSSTSAKKYVMGGSFDRVNIKVYMDIPGDPELCEVMSSIMRATLKNARLYLMENGLNEVNVAYSPIGRNESYGGVNVWTAEFTISGQMSDRWIVSEALLPDQMTLELNCRRGIE
jgi:hypothetical protein